MPADEAQLVFCYNRSCGKKYHPNENTEDACTHHPGQPVFHDAYKGWSCCNKKCIDFTEFLNIKGCTKSFHSNVKPPEPEKPAVDKSEASKVIECNLPKPKAQSAPKPDFNSELVKIKPEISSSLKTQFESMVIGDVLKKDGEIAMGTACKNGACKAVYDRPESTNTPCTHHPGYPVFHEGLKFWTCCSKRTTDFTAFLEQVGCTTTDGHQWIKAKDSAANCRSDWHQTATHVYVSLYAKEYDPYSSTVEINPIRAKIHVVFPKEQTTFDADWELEGIINVGTSTVTMLPTKVELKFKKGEPGTWKNLYIPKVTEKVEDPPTVETEPQPVVPEEANQLVDLEEI